MGEGEKLTVNIYFLLQYLSTSVSMCAWFVCANTVSMSVDGAVVCLNG